MSRRKTWSNSETTRATPQREFSHHLQTSRVRSIKTSQSSLLASGLRWHGRIDIVAHMRRFSATVASPLPATICPSPDSLSRCQRSERGSFILVTFWPGEMMIGMELTSGWCRMVCVRWWIRVWCCTPSCTEVGWTQRRKTPIILRTLETSLESGYAGKG